jgi:hypothetical protein
LQGFGPARVPRIVACDLLLVGRAADEHADKVGERAVAVPDLLAGVDDRAVRLEVIEPLK